MRTESDLLERIRERSAGLSALAGGRVLVGPGDDCAVVRLGEPPAQTDLLLTVDQVVSGRHYDGRASVEEVARKSIARSVSDIAAMAGRPVCALATGALSDSFAEEDPLFDAMARWGAHWGCPLVGGDIARVGGPTVLTVTVVGRPHPGRGPVLRSGARPGDLLYVTGALGGSLASGRHLSFEPRLPVATWLADSLGARLHAMIDLSDGLGRDAARIARASAVRLVIDAERLPMHEGVSSWRQAAGDGEDYELLFASDAELPTDHAPGGVPIRRIGRVESGSGCLVVDGAGAVFDGAGLGWDHGGQRA